MKRRGGGDTIRTTNDGTPIIPWVQGAFHLFLLIPHRRPSPFCSPYPPPSHARGLRPGLLASLACGRLPLRVTEHLRISRWTVMTATAGRVRTLIRQRIDRYATSLCPT